MRRAIARFAGAPRAAERGDQPGLIRALRRLVPGGLQLAVANAVPQWVRDAVVAREITGGYVWKDTWGLCLHGDLAGYLRLNVKGREARGALTLEQADALTRFLAEALEKLTLPDGRALVRDISFPARDWPGERAHLLPDLLVEWDPTIRPAPEIWSPTLGTIRGNLGTGRGGNHRFDGFYRHIGPRQGEYPASMHVSEFASVVETMAAADA